MYVRISEKHKIFSCQKGENHERSLFGKIAETAHRASSTEAAHSEHSTAIHSISMAGYVNAVPSFVCFGLPAREASSFCDF